MGLGFWKDTLREGRLKHGIWILEGHIEGRTYETWG